MHQDVAGEGPVVAVDDRARTVLALRGLALEAATAASTPGRGATDHRLTDLPALDAGAQGADGPGELVPGDQAGLAGPPVEQQVDVRTADAAMVHLHQDLARSG